MAEITKIKTPYEQAEKAGKELLRKAKEDHVKRQEYGKKESYQACKEAAHYLVGQARGRISVTGGYTYCCFDCIHHKTNIKIQGKPICVVCNNGAYFTRRGQNA